MNKTVSLLVGLLYGSFAQTAAPPTPLVQGDLPGRAQAILKTHCHRCHGQNGTVEGGFNYVLDRDKLVARGKVRPNRPDQSRLYQLMRDGKMPPPGESLRPSKAEIQILRDWIARGASPATTTPKPERIADNTVLKWILADLDTLEDRTRRFTRYFSLVPLANAGASQDELTTYRHALAKLINSLSWHPRISLPRAIDARGLVLRIDLRDYLLDASLWNRVLNDYPYGVLHDSAIARSVLIATGTRMPVVRADWFVATASRAPLYYDLLQLPSNLGELERQLRVDVTLNIQQERAKRAGFNGSGISRNNRLIERHDAITGAYWRTYDFEAVPQNLIERNILLPDRRNLFAYPLGPGGAESQFQHAGGEAIFNLPNGLQGYILVNADNVRINKGPTEIVSDPKRPDRAVEAGLSCMHCHAQGIIPKDDQLREHVHKNAKVFARNDINLVDGLHPKTTILRKWMADDARRFQQAVEKTGNTTTSHEVIMAMTLQYEADVDLIRLAAELGVTPQRVMANLGKTETLSRNLGSLKVDGGTVSRSVVVQSFGDLVKAIGMGQPLEVAQAGELVADATGEKDPLEAQSSPANAIVFRPASRIAAVAGNDRSVRMMEVILGRELQRGIGHTATVWSLAFTSTGDRLISGGKDGMLRIWDGETARELHAIEAHQDLITSMALSPDNQVLLSAGFDNQLLVWDLPTRKRLRSIRFPGQAKYITDMRFTPDGSTVLIASRESIHVFDRTTWKQTRRIEGHSEWINQLALSTDGAWVVSASDDGTVGLIDLRTGKILRKFRGHQGPVMSVAISPDRRLLVTGGADATVRLWDAKTGKEIRAYRKHERSVVAVTFLRGQDYIASGSRDGQFQFWKLSR